MKKSLKLIALPVCLFLLNLIVPTSKNAQDREPSVQKDAQFELENWLNESIDEVVVAGPQSVDCFECR